MFTFRSSEFVIIDDFDIPYFYSSGISILRDCSLFFFLSSSHPSRISKKNHVTFYFCHCHLFSNSMKRSEVDQCCNRIIGTVNGLVCYLALTQTTSRHRSIAVLPCRSSSSFQCSSAPSLSDPSARLLEVSRVEPSPGMFRILFKIEWLQAIAHNTSNPCF